MIDLIVALALLALPVEPSCTTDSQCAAWEVAHNIPESQRAYGSPEGK